MKVRALAICAVLGAMLCAGQSRSIPVGAAGGSDQAVAYQINVAHNGGLSGDALAPPLVQRWSLNMGGPVSYPLIAGGMVYVTVGNVSNASGPNYGSTLYALNESTGATVWSVALGGTYYWSAAAYDAGDVFAVNTDGLLQAFNASTGSLVWSVKAPGQTSFSGPPVAGNGTVFLGGAGSGGTLYAFNETNGASLWTASVMNGDDSSPALSASGVYVSYACPQTYDFAQSGGSPIWHYAGPCEGGGGSTPALYGSNLYVVDWVSSPRGYVFDATTGSNSSRFDASALPAFSGNTGVFLSGSSSSSGGTLRGQDLTSGSQLWSFAGDGGFVSTPIIVNNDVYEGSTSGNLYAFDLTTGQQVWSTNVGSSITGSGGCCTGPTTGLGAGEGYLVVPAGSHLVAYSDPPPSNVAVSSVSSTEGASFSGTIASFTDSSPNAASDVATVAWGDGNSSPGTVIPNNSGGFSVTGTHRYADEGSYTVRVTVTGSFGSGSGSGRASVADAPLSSVSGYSLSATAAATVSGRVATFGDANPACPMSDFAAGVSWGDGTASSPGTVAAGSGSCSFDVSGSHVYAVPGTYAVTTTSSDIGGSKATTGSTVTVGTPRSTGRTSVSASNNANGISISLSASVKNGNGTPAGSLSFKTATTTITSTQITSVINTGTNTETVYGTGTQNGSAVNFAASVLGNQATGKNTFRIRTNTGYDSGMINIATAKVS